MWTTLSEEWVLKSTFPGPCGGTLNFGTFNMEMLLKKI